VFYNNENISKKNDEELATFRNRTMGFVFQFHHLLKEFTALENVMMPCRIAGTPTAEAKKMAEELLNEVGGIEKQSTLRSYCRAVAPRMDGAH
jgi:lipoprotein-releasing system ATP-binding protein